MKEMRIVRTVRIDGDHRQDKPEKIRKRKTRTVRTAKNGSVCKDFAFEKLKGLDEIVYAFLF